MIVKFIGVYGEPRGERRGNERWHDHLMLSWVQLEYGAFQHTLRFHGRSALIDGVYAKSLGWPPLHYFDGIRNMFYFSSCQNITRILHGLHNHPLPVLVQKPV